jgi:hypothetical protein
MEVPLAVERAGPARIQAECGGRRGLSSAVKSTPNAIDIATRLAHLAGRCRTVVLEGERHDIIRDPDPVQFGWLGVF